MQRVQHDGNAGAAVNPQHILEGITPVVVFEHEAAAHRFRQGQEVRNKAFAPGRRIVVDTAHVHHDHGVAIQPHRLHQRHGDGQLLLRTALRVVRGPLGERVQPPLPNQHSDFLDPFAFLDLIHLAQQVRARPFDVMLEAKAKDLALLRLRQQIAHFAPELAGAVA